MNENSNEKSAPTGSQSSEHSTTVPLSFALTTPPGLQIKAALLVLLMVLLVGGAVVYLMYARGVFEATQKLVLVADDSEGVVVGMDLTFSGFPIGRVSQIELSAEGNARMIMEVPKKDAHWLRSTSIFTLERGLVGSTKLRAYSGILTDPALEDGATRALLVGDASSEIPKLVATAKELIQNLKALTAADSSLDASLGNVKTLTEKLNGKGGALGAILGDEKHTEKLLTALDRTNSLLAKVDGMAAKADTQVFGPNGVMKDAQATVVQLNAMLAEARTSLKKVDAILVDAQAVSANAKAATADLGVLRADVESSLRKVDHLINEINRKWPFKRDAELKLP
jgi:phospholipid/cholesterol/gamma-HCH transport system substrate-binding protein